MSILQRAFGSRHASLLAARSRQHRRRRRALNGVLVDAGMLLLAVGANGLGASRAGASAGSVWWIVLYVVLTLAVIGGRGGYGYRLEVSPFEYLGQVIAGAAIAAALVVGARVLFAPDPDAATQVVRLWLFASAYLMAGRLGVALGDRRMDRAGLNTLIVGAGDVGRLVARRLQERPQMGLRPIGFLDANPRPTAPGTTSALPVLGASWDLERIVDEHDVEHVIVSFSTAPHSVLLGLVRRCRTLDIEVSLVPRLFEETSRRITVEHLGGIALLRVGRADPRGWQFDLKYAFDRVAGATLVALFAPLMVLIAVAVKATSPGPMFFRQSRIGLDGREFDILKFRTMLMVEDAPQHDAAWFSRTLGRQDGEAAPESPATELAQVADRRTRLGRILRRTSLDELPQLLNIVRGEMSLVGPRPERTGYVRAFEGHVYRYGDRHRVKSGLTGWAQVHGLRGETSLADRTEWDNFYVENWSPWLDLKILLLTLPVVARRSDG